MAPILQLAPMQDVSVLALWRAMEKHGGGPDAYVTEYFRVHANARPQGRILASITDPDLGKPVIAQMIGNDPAMLADTAVRLQDAGAAGVDLNLGCPAPVVCGKSSGGALLRDPELIREIVLKLRPLLQIPLTLKTRIGFESPDEFPALLDLFAELPIDGLAVHGRTVREKYQSDVHTDEIAEAVERLPFPVLANGSVISADTGLAMLKKTEAAGLMIGRGAIRNPWLFGQIRARLSNETPYAPSLRDLRAYIANLYEEVAVTSPARFEEASLVHRMKKFLNYIASGINPSFTHEIRRAQTPAEFHEICDRHLLDDAPFPDQPSDDGRLFCGFEALSEVEENL